MLIIRDQQLQAFRSVLERKFIVRLAGHLTATFPERAGALGREAVEQRAAAAFVRAKRFGLKSEAHATKFSDLDFALGAEFENREDMAWALPVLQDDDLSPANKIYRLFRRCELRGIEIYPRDKERSPGAAQS